jgi:RHS repeat-associated protein
LLEKAYHYDASDNLVREVLTQTQRRGASSTPTLEISHVEQLIGRFHDLTFSGKSYNASNRYAYDLNERLQCTNQNRPGWQTNQIEDFKYDKAGNLFDGPKLNGLIKHNRVLVYQDNRYRYDRFGRLCEKRIGSNWVQYFEYDAEHRLICVDQYKSSLRERVLFIYDSLGRRISKEVYQDEHPEPIRRTLFHWQGLRLLQEVQRGLSSVYVYASPDSYEPLARIDGKPGQEDIQYFHTNLAGLPEQLTDADGETLWRSDYQGWGRTRDEWHSQRQAREQNLRHQGQYLDRETGLHYNIFRYYDAELGRFTQHDPINLSGGINQYNFAPNSSLWIDPLGLSCTSSYSGKLSINASDMKPIARGTRAWHQAVQNLRLAVASGQKFQVKVRSSTDAKILLHESLGRMNRYKAHTQSKRADGIPKYPKGYEQHMSPENSPGNRPHIKWYFKNSDGHIFYDIPN